MSKRPNGPSRRRPAPMHLVLRRGPAPPTRVQFEVYAELRSGLRILIGTAASQEDAAALAELVVVCPGGAVCRVAIEKKISSVSTKGSVSRGFAECGSSDRRTATSAAEPALLSRFKATPLPKAIRRGDWYSFGYAPLDE